MADVTTKNIVVKINTLKKSDENPRKIGRKQFEELKKSLVEFPEMKQLREIIVDEKLTILAGHQRVYALEDLNYEDIEVKQVFGLTAKQKREFMIKDNVSAGEWDSDVIANLWDLDELESFGVPAFKLPGGGGDGNEKSYEPHAVTCPNCGEHFELNKDS